MTNDQIYKAYKHGELSTLHSLSAKRVYNALKKADLQTVLVKNMYDKYCVYIYEPSFNRFYKVMGEK
jgi:hypothetical protein